MYGGGRLTVGDRRAVIVTGHQPTFLPGVSVVTKLAGADAVIWCDEMQFTRHDWMNRNRISSCPAWLVVPFDNRDIHAPINRVRIADPTYRARRKVARTLTKHLGEAAEPYADELLRPYRRIVGLNMALLRLLLADLSISAVSHMQSHLDSGVEDGRSASERIADMTAELGGDVWLSGPQGIDYLDQTAFDDRGIELRFHPWDSAYPNPSALELVARATPLAQAIAARRLRLPPGVAV